MQAKIYERGNGWPVAGCYVQDREGSLYRVTGESFGPIQTGQPGEGNWLLCEVEEADWSDLGEGEEPFPALCVPEENPIAALRRALGRPDAFGDIAF